MTAYGLRSSDGSSDVCSSDLRDREWPLPDPNCITTRRPCPLALPLDWSMEASMVMRSPLDDNDTARTAWARYRRLMWGMAIVSLVAVAGALLYLRSEASRGGKGGVRTCRSRWSPSPSKNNTKQPH